MLNYFNSHLTSIVEIKYGKKIFTKNNHRLTKKTGTFKFKVATSAPRRSRLPPVTVAMPLPFNKTLDLKLLALVRENPIIYNSKHPKYLFYDTREVVWQRIGDILNRPASVCKTRWVNVRDMMRRKIRDRLRNPNQRIYNYKYEDELAFMLPYYRETQTNICNEEYSDLENSSNCHDIEKNFQKFRENGESKQSSNCQKTNDGASSSFNNEYQELNPADPLDVFLIAIGSTLRKFSPYYLNQAKTKIFQVVQDYELKQIVGKENSSGTSSSVRSDSKL